MDDRLYRLITVSRAANTCLAYSYDDEKNMLFVWSDIQRKATPGFTSGEVSKMIMRGTHILKRYIQWGEIPAPRRIYAIDSDIDTRGRYIWSEKDIFGLHDYLLTVHRGRPRNDGFVRPQKMPTKAELRAMMSNNEEVMYVKSGDEFKPVWRSEW